MSMPIITPGITKCQAISDVIESVALIETALSHILNAEGEKIQAALGTLLPDQDPIATTTDELLAINKSVDSVVASATILESLLQKKLAVALGVPCP